MISVAEAQARVLDQASALSPSSVPIECCLGRVLQQEIRCTIDSPPFDKSQVDGFAVRCSDVAKAGTQLRLAGELTAGQVATAAVQSGTTIRIMTGAPIPDGTDVVVMLEKCEVMNCTSGETLIRLDEVPRPGQNILRRGAVMRLGQTVLRPGHRLRAVEIGLLAELGMPHVLVTPSPQVEILSTGDELIPHEETPQLGQIRNSNGPMLAALVTEAGGLPVGGHIVRDNAADLTAAIRQTFHSDVLILSGGVSAGVLDLVPAILKELGVEEVFHKVQLKPGKPLWFGVRREKERIQLVFGLPGNPVSSLVGFHLFVRPALFKLAGYPHELGHHTIANLSAAFQHRGDRPTYYPGKADWQSQQLVVVPLSWRGSADLRTLVDANVLMCLEPGNYDLASGSPVTVRWLS